MFTEIFVRILQEKHLSAYKVAKETGISQGLMNEYKNGVKLPTLQNLARIADYLNCSVDYLLGRADNPTVTYGSLSPDECKLLERYRSLSEDDRITALGDLIRFASEKASIKSEAPEDAEAPSGADLVAHWDLLGQR